MVPHGLAPGTTMKLQTVHHPFLFITDCFSGNAEGKASKQSALRVPPIRGHVRMWHQCAFGLDSCNRVWGSTAENGSGSRVSIALKSGGDFSAKTSEILPHSEDRKKRGNSPCISAGHAASIDLIRLPLCSRDDWDKAQKAVRLWLLLGSLGLRSNRAAGSVWPADPPRTPNAFRQAVNDLGLAQLQIALIGLGKNRNADELRTTASDTVSRADIFGTTKPRTPSPTKFKVVDFEEGMCLVATAPGKKRDFIRQAESALINKTRWQALGAWNYI